MDFGAESLRAAFAFHDLEANADRIALRVRVGSPRAPRDVTYGQLFARVAHASRVLADAGVAVGDRIALLLPHTDELVVAFLACIRHGAIPAILAWPTHKMDVEKYLRNLAAVVAGLGAQWLVTDASMRTTSGVLGQARFVDTSQLTGVDVAAQPTPLPGDLSFVQFSGGTTGTQKSVPIATGRLSAQLSSYALALALRAEDRVATWLPLYHDMGLIACLVMPFVARLPIAFFAPSEWVRDPTPFLAAVLEDRSTLMWLPNFAFSFMAQRVLPDPSAIDLRTVRAFVNCSEPIRAASIDAFGARFAACGLRPAALHTSYAMAEATFAVTQSTDDAPPLRRSLARHRDEPARILVSSGRPIANVEVRVVDGAGAACADGDLGEIHLRGPFVMDGYLRGDAAAAAPIVDGWYATGDLGTFVDGHLFVTGRKKDLVVVGGVNVHPEDVEVAASEVRGVRAGRVVAFGVFDEAIGTEHLTVVAEAETEADLARTSDIVNDIRTAVLSAVGVGCHDVVVVPRGWVVKSTAGKISRAETRARLAARGRPQRETSSEGGERSGEQRVIDRVARRLGLDAAAVPRSRPLASFGVDSLLALELQADLEEEFSTTLTTGDVLGAASIAELATLLESGTTSAAAARPEAAEEMPASANHAWMLFLGRQIPAGKQRVLHVDTVFDVHGAVRDDDVAAAYARLVARHDALRAVFSWPRGKSPSMRVLPSVEAAVHIVDARGLTGEELEAVVADDLARPFAPETGPLSRLSWYRLGDADVRVVFAAHHLVADLWSLAVLLDGLLADVRGARGPREPERSAFVDYLAWHRDYLASEPAAADAAYWSERLPPAPADRPLLRAKVRDVEAPQVHLPRELTARVREVANQRGLTVFEILFASFLAALRLDARTDDVVAYAPSAGRRPPFLRTVGWLTSGLPYCLAIPRTVPLDAIVSSVAQAVRDARRHQFFVPPNGIAFSDTPSFTMQNVPPWRGVDWTAIALAEWAGTRVPAHGLELTSVAARDRRTIWHPLHVVAAASDDEIRCIFRYATDVYERSAMDRRMRDFRRVLQAVIEDPALALDDIG